MDNSSPWSKAILFAVVLACLYASFALLYRTVEISDRHSGKDFVSAFEERIKRVKPFLGNETSVGYFFAVDYQTARARDFKPPSGDIGSGESAENSARGSLVNYALRPLGIFLNFQKETNIMITDFTRYLQPTPQNIKLRETEYTLMHDFGDGLSVYRRKR